MDAYNRAKFYLSFAEVICKNKIIRCHLLKFDPIKESIRKITSDRNFIFLTSSYGDYQDFWPNTGDHHNMLCVNMTIARILPQILMDHQDFLAFMRKISSDHHNRWVEILNIFLFWNLSKSTPNDFKYDIQRSRYQSQ